MKLIKLLLCLVLLYGYESIACTTAIISGKFTRDGRPLLWKHRDSDELNNIIKYFSDGKYTYIGLADSKDTEGKAIWIGCNSAGFAIMNSASYNLKSDTFKLQDLEGELMKEALMECGSVDEFEKFLKKRKKPLGVEANFGVIDAKGGAAYFETNNFDFVKIDVNDTKIAPMGYVIRTNYSFTGKPDDGYGYIRYIAAEDLLFYASSINDISPQFIIQKMSRSLKHGLTGVNLKEEYSNHPEDPKFVTFEDFIPRNSSSASVIIEGVKKGESPEFTTMWAVVGWPLTSVVMPVWVAGKTAPSLLLANAKNKSALCNKALDLKDKCFPIARGNGYRYLNINALYNGDKSGIMQLLQPLEDKIFLETKSKLNSWRKEGMTEKAIKEYYQQLDKMVADEYLKLFGI
jgi:hypothetical protein